MAKYVLTQETLEIDGHRLFRIKALIDIARHDIKAGDYGGFVESEANLSQEGDAWVDERACVFENAWVGGNALLYGDVIARGNSRIFEDAEVGGRTDIYGNAAIYGAARIHNEVCIVKDSGTCGTLWYARRDACWEARWSHITIRDNAEVYGTADITGNVIMQGAANIHRGEFYGDATIAVGETYDLEKRSFVVLAAIYNADNPEASKKDHPIEVVKPKIKVVTSNLTDAVAAAV